MVKHCVPGRGLFRRGEKTSVPPRHGDLQSAKQIPQRGTRSSGQERSPTPPLSPLPAGIGNSWGGASAVGRAWPVCRCVPRSASASQSLWRGSREPTWPEPGRGGRSAVGLLHGPLPLRLGVRAGARDWVGLGGPTHAEPCVVPPLLPFSVGPGSGQWVWRGTRFAGRAPRGTFRHWPTTSAMYLLTPAGPISRWATEAKEGRALARGPPLVSG